MGIWIEPLGGAHDEDGWTYECEVHLCTVGMERKVESEVVSSL